MKSRTPTVEVEQPAPVREQPEIEMVEPTVDVEVGIETAH